jgi:hypothetical protein
MLKLCSINIKRSKEILKIERYKRKIIKTLSPQKIILFGSFGRGDFNQGSDIDLIVICDCKENFLDRIKALLESNDLHLPVEPIGYTQDEFKQMAEEENPFIAEILQKGIPIYQKSDITLS